MRTRTIPVTAAALLLPLCLAAQEAKPQPARMSPEPAIVSLDFPGGSLANFVRALRVVQPDVNIVMAPRADEAMVPRMDLRGTDIDQALETACMVAEGPVKVDVKNVRGRGAPVYTILAFEPSRRTHASGPRTEADAIQRVFTLNPLTMDRSLPDYFVPDGTDIVKPLSVEAVLSAVELATTLDGKAPVLRYHKDSGLLIVRGTVDQVSMAQDTLLVLQEDLQRRHDLVLQKLGQERQARRQTGAAPDQQKDVSSPGRDR